MSVWLSPAGGESGGSLREDPRRISLRSGAVLKILLRRIYRTQFHRHIHGFPPTLKEILRFSRVMIRDFLYVGGENNKSCSRGVRGS